MVKACDRGVHGLVSGIHVILDGHRADPFSDVHGGVIALGPIQMQAFAQAS
jgi:hypothetical protein